MPASIRVTGTNKEMEMTANACGKEVNRTTTATMTQMWFVSQTGPMARAMRSLRAAERGPLLRRSRPAPKSAPEARAELCAGGDRR
jgi:hypothetical protein